MKPITVFTSFSGYDSQCMALRNLGVDYELVGTSEIDKSAILAHAAIHSQKYLMNTPSAEVMIAELRAKKVGWDFKEGKCTLPKDKSKLREIYAADKASKNYGDICGIDWNTVPDFDLFTYSFPCTDISMAGQTKGFEEGSGTASSLLWECRKAIKAKLPKYLLMENVKALTFKKNVGGLEKWKQELEGLGYQNFTQVLNARDYGVPQNRERVFMVSILGGGRYKFPDKIPLETRLKDVLESEVDEKYYLSEKLMNGFLAHREHHAEKGNGFGFSPSDVNKVARCISTQAGARQSDNFIADSPPSTDIIIVGSTIGDCNRQGTKDRVYSPDGIMATLTSSDYKQPKQILQLGEVTPNSQAGKVYSNKGLFPTVCAGTHGYAMGYVDEPQVSQLNTSLESGGKQPYQQNRIYDTGGLIPTIGTTNAGNIIEPKIIQKGRGFNKGGEHEVVPVITASSWECNNFLKEPIIVASRGRNPKDSSDRTVGAPTEQRLEPNTQGIANTLTTVQKDNYVLLFKDKELNNGDGLYLGTSLGFFRGGLNDVSRTLKAETHDAGVVDGFRIRKLTPLECWRLMGVSDEDFYKAQRAGLSDTQLYKLAGNSIVVPCLEGLFKNLFSAELYEGRFGSPKKRILATQQQLFA